MRDMQCPTVRIKSDKAPGGFVVINQTDFDDATHELHESDPHKKADLKADNHQDDVQTEENWRDLHWKKQVKLAKSLGFQGSGPAEAKAYLTDREETEQ